MLLARGLSILHAPPHPHLQCPLREAPHLLTATGFIYKHRSPCPGWWGVRALQASQSGVQTLQLQNQAVCSPALILPGASPWPEWEQGGSFSPELWLRAPR